MALSTLVLAGIVTPIILQQRTIQRLRTEKTRALEEVAALRDARPAQNPVLSQIEIDAAELERLRGEHAELLRLRGEVSLLRQQTIGAKGSAVKAAGAINQPAENQTPPFAEVTKEIIPSGYRFIEVDEQGKVIKSGMVTLHADGSFTNPEGERGGAYKWQLHPQGLMLAWRSGIMLFNKVAAPGVYVATKENNQTVRLEREQ
jgi:hypothetical protein